MENHVLSAGSWPRPLPGRRVITHASHERLDISAIHLLDAWIELGQVPTIEALAASYQGCFVNARVAEILVAKQNRIPGTWSGLEIAFLGTQFRSTAKTYESARYVNYLTQNTTGFWEIRSAQVEAVLTAVARGETQVRLALIPHTIH